MTVDFSILGDLGNVYRDARLKANRERTLAELGRAGGALDYSTAAKQLLAAGDVQGALSLATLGRSDRDFALKERMASPTYAGQVEEAKQQVAQKYSPKTRNFKIDGEENTFEPVPGGGWRRVQVQGTAPEQTPAELSLPPNVDKKKFREKNATDLAETWAAKPKAEAAVRETHSNIDRLVGVAKKIRDNPALWRVTGAAGQLPSIGAVGPWGGEAANLEAQIETLLSQTGISTLNAMREASKTGGAVGNVTEKEWPILQSNLAAMSRKQSPEQFKKSLDELIAWGEGAKTRTKQTFDETYSRFQPQRGQPAPKSGGISKAEYDALPSGATYTAPDGSTRTKR